MKLVLLLCCLPLLTASAGLLGANQPCWDKQKELDARREAAGGVLPPGSPTPVCDRLGRYAPKQCSGSQCYCVDPDGKSLAKSEQSSYTVNRWEADKQACRCAREKFEIQQDGKVGSTITCDDKGDYHHTQCEGSICFCHNPVTGERQESSSTHVAEYAKLTAECEKKEY